MRTRRVLAVLVAALPLALSVAAPGSATVYVTSSGTESTSWQLAWSSDFSGAAGTPLPGASGGSSGWNFEQWPTQLNSSGQNVAQAVNSEEEYYVSAAQNAATQNAVLDGNGDLAITVRPNTNPSLLCEYDAQDKPQPGGTPCAYTSARLDTTQLVPAQAYGRIEARIELPAGGTGIWPAFWAMGASCTPFPNLPPGSWPGCGEIDMMEDFGAGYTSPPAPSGATYADTIQGTLHGPETGNAAADYPAKLRGWYRLPNGQSFASGFHIFGMDWYPNHVSFTVDGNIYYTVYKSSMPSNDTWVFDHPFYLLLNVAAGGSGGADTTHTAFPQTMLVNYVKVYTSATPPVPAAGPVTGIAGKCLDDYHSGTANGNPVDLWTCNQTAAQNWAVDTDGTVRIGGKCMDPSGGGTTGATPVVLQTCDGSAAEQWRIETDGSLLNVNSGLCLHDKQAATTDGNPVNIYLCDGAAASTWTYPVPPASDWPLTDGTGTTATDTGSGQNATLNGGASWASDPSRGTVLSLDGATGYGVTAGKVINTTGSFTVSAWVNLATAGAGRNEAIVAQDGTQDSAFYLSYNDTCCSQPGWGFAFPKTDSPAPAWFPTAFSAGVTTGAWTQLTGVYNAATQTANLYVNGTLKATVTGITPYNATGPLTIGADQWQAKAGDFFPGKISNVQVFNRALDATQVQALYTES